MKWSEDYATGFERIDHQHRTLFKMTGDFGLALDDDRGESVYSVLLRALKLYAQAHFKGEEQCMRECACPVADRNRQEHGDFMRLLQDYKTRYHERGFSQGDARQLHESLGNWLHDHIINVDLRLRDCRPNS